MVERNARSFIVSPSNRKELRYMKLCGKAGKLHLLHCKRSIPLMLLEWVFKSTRKTSNDFSYDLRSKLFLIN